MVQFSGIDDALAMKRRLAGEAPRDPVNRALVGNSSRIDIPLRDRALLTKSAEYLMALAERLIKLSNRGELDETAVLLMAKNEISLVKRAIGEAHGSTNKNGTYSRVPRNAPS